MALSRPGAEKTQNKLDHLVEKENAKQGKEKRERKKRKIERSGWGKERQDEDMSKGAN